MTLKYLNKYRIPSTRMKNWDYGSNAAYFITVCTKNRIHYFGDVVNGDMVLSEIGGVVESEWLKTFELRPDMHLQMGEYVVMPDHFHAIITIGKNQYNQRETEKRRRDAMHCVSTSSTPSPSTFPPQPLSPSFPLHCVPLSPSSPSTPPFHSDPVPQNQFGPQSKNLASIVRGFKIGVTKNARLIDPGFAWQQRFHDHIIRDYPSYLRIEKYITDNPLCWEK